MWRQFRDRLMVAPIITRVSDEIRVVRCVAWKGFYNYSLHVNDADFSVLTGGSLVKENCTVKWFAQLLSDVSTNPRI